MTRPIARIPDRKMPRVDPAAEAPEQTACGFVPIGNGLIATEGTLSIRSVLGVLDQGLLRRTLVHPNNGVSGDVIKHSAHIDRSARQRLVVERMADVYIQSMQSVTETGSLSQRAVLGSQELRMSQIATSV